MHKFTGELVLILTRSATASDAVAMEEYMRALVSRFGDLIDHSDSVNIKVSPVPCGSPCATCDMSSSLLAELRLANLREYLVSEAVRAATPDELASIEAGVREVEVAHVARRILFRPFDEFARRTKRNQVDHEPGCSAGKDSLSWLSSVTPAGSPQLGARECATLWRIANASMQCSQHEWMVWSGAVPKLEVRTHEGRCTVCHGGFLEHGLLVTIPWAGRTLSREYLL